LEAPIDAAQFVVMLGSKAAAEFPFVQLEIGKAIQAGSSDSLVLAALDDTAFPVRLRDPSGVPLQDAKCPRAWQHLIESTSRSLMRSNKPAALEDNDRQMVKILAAVLSDDLQRVSTIP
jgi:hypothetical protein